MLYCFRSLACSIVDVTIIVRLLFSFHFQFDFVGGGAERYSIFKHNFWLKIKLKKFKAFNKKVTKKASDDDLNFVWLFFIVLLVRL